MTESTRISSNKKLCHAARSHFFQRLNELNLFSDHPIWSSTLNHSEQVISTRLFLISLVCSLLVIVFYGLFNIRTHTITHEKFSLVDYEQIQAHYSSSIIVPCTQIANPYSNLIHIDFKFHEICSSSFINQTWISSLFLSNATSHNILDFRTFTFAQFQALALLCQTARDAIDDGYRTFNSTQLITTHLRSRADFDDIVRTVVANLRSNIIAHENQMSRIVSMNIGYNRLMSALRTNFYIEYDSNLEDFIMHNGIYFSRLLPSNMCICRFEGNQCAYPAGAFFNWTKPELDKPARAYPPAKYRVSGLMAGCLPLESIRQSTLECLYSQTCIDILSLQPNMFKVKPLKISRTNLTIGQMFDEHLFIESWQNTSNYEVYFNACAPRTLTYSYQGSDHFTLILAQCVDASGGLAILWALIIPLLIRIWPFMKSKTASINRDRCYRRLYQTISTLNLFPSDDKDDLDEQYIGIISTRLYILLLFLGLISLVFCTSFLKRLQTITVHLPTIDEFERLNSLYKSSLVCTCTHHSLSYGRIVSFTPRYHQICTSEFLQETWLSYFNLEDVYHQVNVTPMLNIDFRISGRSFFSFVDALCREARQTVDNSIYSFRYHRLVTVSTLSQREFINEMQIRIKEFQEHTIVSFVNIIELIRSSIQINQLITDVSTNAGITLLLDKQTSKLVPRFFYLDLYNSSCSCGFTFRCTRPQGFYSQSSDRSSDPKIIIPGLVLGCYTIDSLLFSTFECFYSQKCLQLILDSRQYDHADLLSPLRNSTRNIQALDQNQSRFLSNDSIQTIVSQLFIEDWNHSINFTAYYNRCSPKQCTYTINKRFDWSYIIAMELGLYKTLSVLLEISLPWLVRCLRRYATKQSSFKCQHIRYWNLFENKATVDNQQRVRQEIVATRIYIFTFILCLIVAILYAGPFSNEIKTKIFVFPTLSQVNELHTKNISSLSCKCSTTAIPYSNFLVVKPKYHPICSSKYIQRSHRINLFNKRNRTLLELNAHYRTVGKLCFQSKRTIQSARDIFNSRDLISIEAMTETSFYSQTDALIQTFITQLSADYRRTMMFIMRSFEVNHLFNILASNWKMDLIGENGSSLITTYPRRFSSTNCSCATSFDCIERIDDEIVTGCFVYDGFRLSTYENMSLGQLNDRLFVENWIRTSNYTAYFNTCQPSNCQYKIPNRFHFEHILLTVFELYGSKFI